MLSNSNNFNKQKQFETTECNLENTAYAGSMQRVLSNHTGEEVIAEFLIGSNNIISKNGILYDVGDKYIVIFNENDDTYTVGDIYALKFITFRYPQRQNSARY